MLEKLFHLCYSGLPLKREVTALNFECSFFSVGSYTVNNQKPVSSVLQFCYQLMCLKSAG